MKAAGRPSLVAFDLDGTLVDSRRDLADAVNELLVELGSRPLPVDEVGRMVGEGAAVLVSRALSATAVQIPIDVALARFLELYDRRLIATTRPYHGIPELLHALHGLAAVAILTNKPRVASLRIVQELALEFPEEMIVGGDGPYARKPSPQGLLALAKTAAVNPSEVLLVGDSAIDVRTAHAAGSRLCLARYGFGCDRTAVSELRPGDAIVDDPLELLEIVNP